MHIIHELMVNSKQSQVEKIKRNSNTKKDLFAMFKQDHSYTNRIEKYVLTNSYIPHISEKIILFSILVKFGKNYECPRCKC